MNNEKRFSSVNYAKPTVDLLDLDEPSQNYKP